MEPTLDTAPGGPAAPGHDPLLTMLDLERIESDIFRAGMVFAEPYALYGGQVAAQALLAAGRTVEADRLPHSLHGYFLRAGDATLPTVFRVYRDRDGGSFSARRVVATQRGEVIFNMSSSFHLRQEGVEAQLSTMPEVPDPAGSEPYPIPRLFSMEGRAVPQPHEDPGYPTRFWARCTSELPADPLLHASVLTYLSDISTGLGPLRTDEAKPGSSLDHAVWFHHPARMDDWVLTDLVPHAAAAGRGWYTGSLFGADGLLLASLAQETLFRNKRR